MHFSRVLLLFAVFSITTLSAQVNSPYSRYGLGNIFPATFGSANGMAGFSAANFSSSNINYLNPASYADLSFAIFEVGATGNVLSLETTTEKFTSGDANLSYLAFGFPVMKQLRKHKLGLSFGLIPYSGFQYNIFEEEPTEDPLLGTIEYNYVGDGTLYQVYGGLGYKYQHLDSTKIKLKDIKDSVVVYKGDIFSVGGNVAQLFGTLMNITYASFPDQLNSQTTKFETDNRIIGGIYNFGVGYQKQFVRKIGTDRDALNWRFGASFSPQIAVNGTQSVLWTNIRKSGNYEFVTDTIYSIPDTTGNINMPASYQAGGSFSFLSSNKNKNQFTVEAQYSKTMWSTYEGFQDAGNLVDSWRASVAAEFIPKDTKFAFRLGGYSGKSNLEVNGVHLNDIGITAGGSIPIGFSKTTSNAYRNSRINLYINAGQRGSTSVIKENYYNFGIGFTLVDSGWFGKYKLN